MNWKEKTFVFVASNVGIALAAGVIWIAATQPYILLASVLGVLGWRALTGAR